MENSVNNNNFISKDDNDEEGEMHSKSDNIDEHITYIWINQKRFQSKLEESMKDSEFVFDHVNLMYYKCRNISPKCDGSYIDSPDWIKNKETTINLINKKIINAFNIV